MEILGLHPAVVALGIVIIGITLRTLIGILGKTRNEFNPNQLVLSFILGFFASIQLVIISIENLAPDAGELVQLSFLTGQIAAVMGIDAGIKSGGKAIMRRKGNRDNGNKYTSDAILHEDESELLEELPKNFPPGKNGNGTTL